MRSIVILLAGLIAGFVASQLLNTNKIRPPNDSEDTSVGVATATTIESGSPFAKIETLADIDAGTAVGSDNTNQNSVRVQSGIEKPNTLDVSLSEIKHYRELAYLLDDIDKASSDHLLTLVQHLTVQTMGRSNYFTSAINAAIYQRWAVVDIDAALDYITLKIGSPSDTMHFEMEGVSILATIQPDYLQTWMGQVGSTQRSMIEHLVFAGITSQDPEAFVRKIFQQNSGDQRDDPMLYGAVMQWAEQDPEAAWNFLESEGDSEVSGTLKSPILYRWLERDPHGALTELEVLIENTDKTDPEIMMLQDMYGSALAETDPTAALLWVTSLLEPNLQANSFQNLQELHYGLLPSVLYRVADTDPLAVEQWINQLPTEQHQALLPIALPIVTDSLVGRDPLQALTLLEKYPFVSGYDNRQMVVQSWIYQDRQAAADWLASLPSDAVNDQLIVDAAMAIIHEDADFAMSLLNGLQGGVSPDTAISVVANLAAVSQNDAVEWLSQQSDPEVLEAGSLYIDIIHKSTSADDFLARIDRLQSSARKTMLIISFVSGGSAEDREKVLLWLSSANDLTMDERSELEEILKQPSNMLPAGGFYTRD